MEIRMNREIIECARVNGLYDPTMKWYRASDVDAYRAAVERLVEMAENVTSWNWFEVLRYADCDSTEIQADITKLVKAVADVEKFNG